MPKDKKSAKRMIVEEVADPAESQIKPELEETMSSSDTKPVEEIKEKVEELQTITEHIGSDVEKSVDVQVEIAEAVEKVEPSPEKPKTEFIPVRPNSVPSPLFILIPGVLLLGALLGGVYFYEKSVSQNPASTSIPEPSAQPTVQSSALPSASPSAKLDLTKFPVNVQNGSGIPGTAGSAKDLLTKAGFKVSSTGNADNYDYTDTIIKAKSDVTSDFVAKLTTSLSSVYSVGKAQSLPSSSTDAVIVIIGSSKAK